MSPTGVNRARRKIHYGWVVLGALVLVLMASSGMRSTFGVYIKYLEADFGWSRTSLSLVGSLSLFLFGAMGPLAGRLADRFGPRWVIGGALALCAVGVLGTSFITNQWQLFLTAGVLTALGAGGASTSISASIVARWFETKRGLVMGIASSGLSAGQLLIFPLATWLILNGGWRRSFLVLGIGLALVVIPVGVALIRNDPRDKGLLAYGAGTDLSGPATRVVQLERTSLAEALTTPAFWLLSGSFFVCGYTSTGLVMVHFYPHALEHGFSAMTASYALSVMGALNIFGTIASGWICDRFGRKGPLAAYYFVRGLSLLLLLWVWNIPTLHLFAAIFGLNYVSTVPPTSTLTANIFGRYSAGELYGWIFVSHQIGAALGSWIGGVSYDLTGGYTLAFLSAALLAFLASGLVLGIQDEPRKSRPAVTAEPAVSY
ncbi:MAG TPA: MFS transporter [Methylomirabilota bacterium]|nr:MFS transporter [Methylomirabilota bacterium]